MGKLHIQGPRDCPNKPLVYVGAILYSCPLFLKNKSIPFNDTIIITKIVQIILELIFVWYVRVLRNV